jgi:glycosyltransferase involved in cell wall biosynthesis
MASIRIGVNALYLIPGGVGGTEIYLRSLLRACAALDSADEFVIFTNRETGPDLVPDSPRFHHVPLPVRATNRPARILYEQFRLPGSVRANRCDVLFNPGFTVPRRCPCPSVSVFHDLQHKRFPEHFRWFDLPFWNLFLGQSARTSDALLAVSKATADDLVRFYPATAGKIEVVHHGVDEAFFDLASERRSEPMLLCVSTLHPHKNIERLLRVFARLHERQPDLRLVLAGMKGFHTEPVERAAASAGIADAVQITGWIPREELCDLYRRARAFVYPSTFEGFGMPVLEALAAGIPTACSDIAPLREVAGPAAKFFPPTDEAQMLAALESLLSEPQPELAQAGPRQARQFSWQRCAGQTVALLHQTADR